MIFKTAVTTLVVLFSFNLFGQDLAAFNDARLNRNQVGMLVLGSWALLNIGSSPILRANAEGSRKYFYDMNLYWNLVNLGLAGFGYFNAVTTDPSIFDATESLKAQHTMEKILLFNAGLDIGYMLGGLYLIERGKGSVNHENRFKGFGQSLILQGAFLFAFDLVFYLAHQQGSRELYDLLGSIQISPNSLGLNYKF